MKVGIVTFYRVANYGAMLQAYALWHYLESRGHEVVFVQCPRCAPTRRPFLWCFVARSVSSARAKLRAHIRFPVTEFARMFPQTLRCRSWEDFCSVGRVCDAFVVGSDQMWNPRWCSSYLPFVMLDFAAEGKLRVAYAVSISEREWRPDQKVEEAIPLMCKFAAISVREESGAEIVRSLTGRADVQCRIDPALLFDGDFYRKFVFDVGGGAYVFRYLLDEWSDSTAEAEAVSIVCEKLATRRVLDDRTTKLGWKMPICRALGIEGKVSVETWLSRIAHSRFVVTNSFHGTVFAILFHRPFVSLLLKGDKVANMNERAISLLGKLGLSERAVYADDKEGIRKALEVDIDWAVVDMRIEHERSLSAEFLRGVGL